MAEGTRPNRGPGVARMQRLRSVVRMAKALVPPEEAYRFAVVLERAMAQVARESRAERGRYA